MMLTMPLKPVADAQNAILKMMAQAQFEQIALKDAAGRILATDLHAKLDHPSANVSAMDGYALRADGQILPKNTRLSVIGEAAAGHLFEMAVQPDQAVRIFTGAYLPEGTDSVALQEDIQSEDGQIILGEEVKSGQFVRPRGLDFTQGQQILPAGTCLDARHLALAALAGHTQFSVRKKPVIAILSSGDELVAPGTAMHAGQLINSNSVFLAHALRKAGADVVDLGIIRDQKGALNDRLNAALAHHKGFDMILSTGGASVGLHDHIAADLTEDEQSGIEFWRIAMRPGKPLIAAKWRGMPFLGLPGNPVSAGVCALIFVLPAIRHFLGLPALPEIIQRPLMGALAPNDQRQDYIRAEYVQQSDRLFIRPFSKQDSSMLRNFCRADALIIRAPFADAAQHGDSVSVLTLPDGF